MDRRSFFKAFPAAIIAPIIPKQSEEFITGEIMIATSPNTFIKVGQEINELDLDGS